MLSGGESRITFYTDQELDGETGLYNYDARLYDPIIGRFISADIFVQNPYDPQSFNRYSYCRNNPLIYVDPSGYFWLWDWLFGNDEQEPPVQQETPPPNEAQKRLEEESKRLKELGKKVLEQIGKNIDEAFPPLPPHEEFTDTYTYEDWLKSPEGKAYQEKQMEFLMGFVGGGGGKIGKLGKSRFTKYLGKYFGKGFPEKLNKAGKLQPYDPKTGKYLSHNVNVGFKNSPVSHFVTGLAQGVTSSPGVGMPVPVSNAQAYGQAIGSVISNIR